jgi:dimethylhistidine N-methyltransferase
MAILEETAPQLVDWIGDRAVILELGSGASRKTHVLLKAISNAAAYVAIDISSDILINTTSHLVRTYPKLKIVPLIADFAAQVVIPWQELPVDRGRNMVFFPGSTLGNFDPTDACCLLKKISHLAGPGGHLLLGVDLVKPTQILSAAYNDAKGITAQFNLNILMRMKTELAAEVNVEDFAHHAFFNETKSRMEMHLVSLRRQKIRVLGSEFGLSSGETIHTENSYKYTPDCLSELALQAGFQRQAFWTDSQHLFAVALFSRES